MYRTVHKGSSMTLPKSRASLPETCEYLRFSLRRDHDRSVTLTRPRPLNLAERKSRMRLLLEKKGPLTKEEVMLRSTLAKR
jgi:hypothetical protein